MKKYLVFFFIAITFSTFAQERKNSKPDRTIDLGAMKAADKFQIALDCATEKLSSWDGFTKLAEVDCGTIEFSLSQDKPVVIGTSFYFEIFYKNTTTSKIHSIGVKGVYK